MMHHMVSIIMCELLATKTPKCSQTEYTDIETLL